MNLFMTSRRMSDFRNDACSRLRGSFPPIWVIPALLLFLVNDMYIWEDHPHDGFCTRLVRVHLWRSVCQAVPPGSLSSFTPTKWHQTFASFFFGISRKKRRSKTWCLSTREHVFYLGTFLYLKSSAPVWVQAFSMMQPMFRKLDQQEVHTTGSEREVCVFVAWAQN